MTFRVRAFNQQGQPVEVTDPFLKTLNEQQAPPIQGPAVIPPRFQPGGPDSPDGFFGVQGFPSTQLTQQQGPAITPDADFLFANRANQEVLRPFFEDQANRAGLGQGVESLDAQIERLSQGLRQGSNGLSGSERGILRALESGGTESADAYFAGIQQRRGQREQLTGQRDELKATLDALDRDGTSPTQALRDFISDSPGLPNVNPERESAEDVVELFSQAVEARLADTSPGETYDSGLRGQVGENVDRFYNLRNQNKISFDAGFATPNYENFEGIDDYADFFTLDLRLNPPVDGLNATSIERTVLSAAPQLAEELPEEHLQLLLATLLDRVENEQSLAQDEALGQWLAVSTLFTGIDG